MELDYIDDNGIFHLMCACGHTVSGSVKPGDKIALCPNCKWKLRFRLAANVDIPYPELLPDEYQDVLKEGE